jgi:thioredoxin-dependent peroxiredoxin
MSDTPPQIGQAAPDFSAASSSGHDIRLADLRGKAVVLYFYPKDDTPGCTLEGQDFRDLHARFHERGAVILGVSRDSLKSHEKFRCKHEFPFELLSDPDEKLCALFNVIRQKSMYGKQVRGIERSTFLIDREGRLAAEWRKVKVEGHAAEVLAAVEALPG